MHIINAKQSADISAYASLHGAYTAADVIEVFQETGRIGAAMINAAKRKKTIVDWLVSQRMEFLSEAGAINVNRMTNAVILEFDLCDARAKEVCDYVAKIIEGFYDE